MAAATKTETKAPKTAKTAKTAKTKEPATKPAKAEKTGVQGNQLDSLKALADGKARSHNEIAAKTGRDKGNLLRPLAEAGLIKQQVEEGVRGFVFVITAAGKMALEAAAKSAKSAK